MWSPTEVNVTDPAFWAQVGAFFVAAGGNLLRIAFLLVIAVLLAWSLRLVIRRVVARIVNGAKSKASVDDTQALHRSPLAAVRLVQRTRTLGSILQNIVNVAIVIVTLLLVINVVAPNALASLTLLTAAIGAGLGFGAQNIVKDVLNGIFIVAEDQIGIGDIVDLGLAIGIVEYVSVRVTHVRDVNGTLWYVRNGEITRIGNVSQGWSRVIVDVSVPHDADVGAVEDAMLDAAMSIAHEPKWRPRVIEPPEVWGLESVSDDFVLLRLVMKTHANSREDVALELRLRVKAALDVLQLHRIKLHTVMLDGLQSAGRVQGPRAPRTKPTPVTPVGRTAGSTHKRTPPAKKAEGHAGTPEGTS